MTKGAEDRRCPGLPVPGSLVYAELHAHSYFSLLDGASSPEALVERASALGYPALALTDHDGLYGAVRFWRAAREWGIRPVIGAEVELAGPAPDAGGHVTLLAETQQGYANLCRLLSAGQLPENGSVRSNGFSRTKTTEVATTNPFPSAGQLPGGGFVQTGSETLPGGKVRPPLPFDTLARHSAGLLCLSGCRHGAVARPLLARDEPGAVSAAGRLRDLFGPGAFWIELQHHFLPGDRRLIAGLVAIARQVGAGVVATNDAHYAARDGQPLHDVLTCIRHHTTLPEALAGGLLHPNSERFLKLPVEMAALFAELADLDPVGNSARLAARCDVSLDFTAQRLPTFPVPAGHTPDTYLRSLCEARLPCKYDPVSPHVLSQLDHELGVIARTGLAGYFLVVWDIVRFGREQGIRCQGRGSAANSLVAYLLGITPVDPLRHNLLFERFLSEGTHTMPDIDVDFAADRREEVIQYVYRRYGEQHAGMVCNVVTYQPRSALRDVSKVLGLNELVPGTGNQVSGSRYPESPDARYLIPDTSSPIPNSPIPQFPNSLIAQMQNIPRHLSIHVGGMLITAAPLVDIVPVERATMPGRLVVQWDKDSVEDAGLIKIDLLGLRTLGVVEEAAGYLRARGVEVGPDHPLAIDPGRLPLDDPAVYDLLCRADTVGCFQVESRAQMQLLPRLLPRRFEDMIVGIALIRPGPLQGGMVHPYLRRRKGLEPVTYIHPSLEPVLSETLGVIVFQEQVIRVAMVVAGLAPAEGDRLRRVISRGPTHPSMAALRERFLAGAVANGLDEAMAREVFGYVEGFAGFGFCKSHSAAFGLVAYQTLYLKAHFPAEFYCAILNHQPMGFYPPEVVMGDARRHGVAVLHPDVNRSEVVCTLEGDEGLGNWGIGERGSGEAGKREIGERAIRLGLGYVHGVGEAWQERIVERRDDRPFRDLSDFCRRTRLPRDVVENLIRSGALDTLPAEARACSGSAYREQVFPEQAQTSTATPVEARACSGGATRRDLLWALGGLLYQEEGLEIEAPVDPITLPVLGHGERLAWEYELLGMAPGDHVIALYRDTLRAHGVRTTTEVLALPHGAGVRVAGWAVVRQRPPTAKGVLFITLEDEEGLANLIVHPGVEKAYHDTLHTAPLLWVDGQVQRDGGAVSVLVRRVGALRMAL